MGLTSKLQFWTYRLSTVAKSLKMLYTLPPEKVKAFLDSYEIYDCDWADEKEMIQKMGQDYGKEVKRKLVDYYSVLNHLCSIGQVEKMYIPPAMDLSQSLIGNQVLIERKMARDLGLAKGKKVLDIGCGRGRVANHMASHTGAEVIGMNIDPDQLESARRYAQGSGLAKQCQFRFGDLNEIPFPFAENTFDAIYQIQVIFSLSKNLERTFEELHRILKPGGKLGCLDWVSLPKYDPKNAHHASLMKRIKPLIGAIGTLPSEHVISLLKKVGFDVQISEIPSIDGLQAPLIENADKFFNRMKKLVYFLVNCKILPAHFKVLFERLTRDGEALIEADRDRLVTTTYYIVAQKK